jgi:PPOX class probable F420-dependent enzyme
LEISEMRRRVQEARLGHLATVTPGGRPHVVPICFVLVGSRIYSAVDEKKKQTRRLQRLANVRANGAGSVLVDHWAEDWSRLWWVRMDGRAQVLPEGEETDAALNRLVEKYEQYRRHPPPGPVLAIEVESWSGWSAG